MVAENLQKIIPSQGTRLRWLSGLSLVALLAWLYCFFGYQDVKLEQITFVMFADFEKWLFTAYGATEVGDKYSHAVMNK